MRGVKNKILDVMRFNVEEAQQYYFAYGLVLLFSYVGFYFFNVQNISGYESFWLRLTVSVLGIVFLVRKYWPKFLVKYEIVFFYATLTYSLSFFFSYMLLRNQTSSVWHVNGLVGLVMLTFFLDWVSYIAVLLLGFFLAYAIILYGNHDFVIKQDLIKVLYSYSVPVIYFIVFTRARQLNYRQRNRYLEQVEHKVEERTRELREALEVKTNLLNNLNHEVRTPIQGFTNISEGLVDHWREFNDPEKETLAKQIAVNARRLYSLVDNLFDMSRFSAGKILFDFRQEDLVEIIENVIEECNDLYIGESGISIEFIGSKNQVITLLDKQRMAQVLRNLLINAIKFSYHNTVIRVSIIVLDGDIKFSILNYGEVLLKEELVNIFMPFNRGHRKYPKNDGAGLGLSISKEIIEAHHGKIWAEYFADGASFYFTLPLLQVHAHKAPEEKGKIILIIDDEESCLLSMELILKGSKYTLIKTNGGHEGLKQLRSNHDIGLVFLDLMMPDIYGLNVLQEIKQDKKLANIPVILQSGAFDSSEIKRAYDMGIVNYIKKPYDKKTILFSIEQALSGQVVNNCFIK